MGNLDNYIVKIKEKYSNYLNNPEILKLNLSDDEICKWITKIVTIIDANEKCKQLPFNKCVNSHFNHEIIFRDDNGKITTSFIPCEKKVYYKSWKILDFFTNDKTYSIPVLNTVWEEHKNEDINRCNKEHTIQMYLWKIIDNELFHQKNIGVYLFGSYGIGKTHLMYALGNTFIQKIKKTAALIRVPNLVSKISENFSMQPSNNQKLIQDLQEVDFLVLDDIGAEQTKDWFYNQYLFNILDYRFANNKLTCFTSNYKIEEFYSKLVNKCQLLDKDALRLIERIKALIGGTNVINLKDHNYRY